MVDTILKTFFKTYWITVECILTTISIHINGIQYHNLLAVLIISFKCNLKKTDEH